MLVRDVMTWEVTSVGPDTPFVGVVDELLLFHVSGVPVVDDDGRVLGIVTEADLLAKEAYGPLPCAAGPPTRRRRGRPNRWPAKAKGTTAGEVMSTNVVTARPDDDVAKAAALLLGLGLRRLPVVDGDGRLVGIVSRHDLLKMFRVTDDELLDAVLRLLTGAEFVDACSEITTDVRYGVVTLRGTARTDAIARDVEAAVGELAGVVAVRNTVVRSGTSNGSLAGSARDESTTDVRRVLADVASATGRLSAAQRSTIVDYR